MKRCLLSILILFMSFVVYSQTIIENPKYGFSTATTIKPTKIELTDSTTVLYFTTYCAPNFWIMIPDKTYILPDGTGDKLFIKGTEGIPFNQQYYAPVAGEVSYALIFPPISDATNFIDYGEANDGGSWFIYDLRIKPFLNASEIPENFLGNWFNTTTRNWELSFLDTLAVFKNQLWSYDAINLKKGKGSVKLKNNTGVIELFIKAEKSGECRIGLQPDELEIFSKDISNQNLHSAINDAPYDLPIFNLDTAIYSGYFKGYSSRIGNNTFSIYVNDILAGNQNTYLARISDNGYFLVKIPVYYPHYVYVRAGFFNGSVYLEPGKWLFQMVDPEISSDGSLFMGETARINFDLQKLGKIYSFNYYEMKNKILDMKPDDYKAYCLNLHDKDRKALDSVMQTNTIGAKAYQVEKLTFDYHYFSNIIEYQWNFENAYREKYNIPREQRTLPITIDTLTAEYFDFITNENANNPLALVSDGYNAFINRLMYFPNFMNSSPSFGPLEIAEELQKSGYSLTESEKKLMEKTKESEQQVLKLKNENLQKIDLNEAFTDSVNAFYKRHQEFVSQLYAANRKAARIENLEKNLGVKVGICTDIMNAREACRGIAQEYTPVSDCDLSAIQNEITTPFISEYIALCNEQAKSKIKANKHKSDYVKNEVPKTEADQLFDSIMWKYRGKVVYVDFWATWCGPCRSSIEHIQPLKEEMADENVVFVYITNPSSPEKTWLNMIPDIKGEHYRVSTDQWNFLSEKFNISGIPHYVLVGKNGDVINPYLANWDNNALKKELRKRIDE